jgi:hypothetical protein
VWLLGIYCPALCLERAIASAFSLAILPWSLVTSRVQQEKQGVQ